jgi:hypothetical protein
MQRERERERQREVSSIGVKEYSFPTQGGARFALQVGFRTPEMIGPRTMTLVAGSLQYL